MVTKKFLIQSTYGYSGHYLVQGKDHTCNLLYSAMDIWTVTYDGSIEDLAVQFRQLKMQHWSVSAFNDQCQKLALPTSIGRWMLFSVIDSQSSD